jgi:hypothetical protein
MVNGDINKSIANSGIENGEINRSIPHNQINSLNKNNILVNSSFSNRSSFVKRSSATSPIFIV